MAALKVGGAYFKVREIIHMKFTNFVIFVFWITPNNSHYYCIFTYSAYILLPAIFVVSLLAYFFNMYSKPVTDRLWLDS